MDRPLVKLFTVNLNRKMFLCLNPFVKQKVTRDYRSLTLISYPYHYVLHNAVVHQRIYQCTLARRRRTNHHHCLYRSHPFERLSRRQRSKYLFSHIKNLLVRISDMTSNKEVLTKSRAFPHNYHSQSSAAYTL